MLRIAIFTTTRAEFGIMSSFIKKIEDNSDFESLLFVGGTHLKSKYGNTINEIKNMGITITDTFDYLKDDDSNFDIAISSGYCAIAVANLFEKYDFDIISILGDRHELLPIASTAMLYNKPIIHWGGGEFTEGVIDNQIRHMLTKASNIHFVATEKFAENIKNLGENEDRVCVTGSPVIETFNKFKPTQKQELYTQLGLDINQPVVLLTYHPVTITINVSALQQISNVFESLRKFNYQIVVTSPNYESERQVIMDYINKQVKNYSNIRYFDSLGIQKFHSLLPHCNFVIGNSSSGIFEAPYFKIPTINIGTRQKGRLFHKSVINTDYFSESIVNGIKKSQSNEFKNKLKNQKYMFGDGNSSKKAIKFLKSIKIDKNLITKST